MDFGSRRALDILLRADHGEPDGFTFITKQVHGVSWGFAGTIERGSAQMSTQKGYYFLNGMLTEHFDTGQSAPRRVSLPLLPEGGSSQ